MQIMRKHSAVYRTKADGSPLYLERQISLAANNLRVLPAVSDNGLFLVGALQNSCWDRTSNGGSSL